jgi:hypothetical protein
MQAKDDTASALACGNGGRSKYATATLQIILNGNCGRNDQIFGDTPNRKQVTTLKEKKRI